MTNKDEVAAAEAAIERECKFESGELGLSEEHAVAASPEHERAIDESLAMQLISIRFPKSLIDDLKFIAKREGLGGYQPLIRRVITRFAESEFRRLAREQPEEERSLDGRDAREARVACG